MRVARITGAVAAVALAFLLSACGGGEGQTGATSSPGKSAKKSAPAVVKAFPDQQVCDVFSKEDVGRIIGVTINSADNVDLLAGAQPTICNYYVDDNKIKSVGIQWMTVKDALWDDQVAAIDPTPNPTSA